MEIKEKIIQICFIVIFVAVISIIGILTLMNNETLSVKEGRKLTTFPDITLESVMQDNFYTEYTNAFADQLAFRQDLIKWYYLLNLQKYVGDVIKGKDNQLFLSPLIIENEQRYMTRLANVSKNEMSTVASEVVENGSKFIFLSVPRKDVLMESFLPDTYVKGTEAYLKHIGVVKENVSEDVQVIDAYEILKENVEKPYYTTDHHMNIRGAYEIFKTIVNLVNTDGYDIKLGSLEEEFTVKSQVINGSYNRKIGQSVSVGAEELTIIYKNDNLEYTRKDNGKQTTTQVFGKDNTYASAYMGGDMAETVITTNNEDAPNILFVGSSYTNILEALSVCKFKTMVSIDYRDNTTGKSIADYVKEYDIDYTIFICAQQTDSLNISSIKQHLGLK